MYELASPVRLKVIMKYLSQVLIGAAFVIFIPFLAAAFSGETFVAAIYLLITAVIFLAGFVINKILPEDEMERKEAVIIVALVFPLLALICTYPLTLLTDISFTDAFFEAVSGVTTTGLSVSPQNPGDLFLFMRSWLQWIGGIGILVIALITFSNPGASAYRLYSVNTGDRKLRPTVFATAKVIISLYVILTLISFVLLLAGGMPVFDALCHSMSSVSTGGFSTSGESVSGFPGYFLPLIVTVSCILGAINFGLYPSSLENIRNLFSDIQIKYFFAIGIFGSVVLLITLGNSYSFDESISVSFFQAFSALTTSGFSTVDTGSLPDVSKVVISALMWAGGCMGSTAGGIKIIRLIILLKIIQLVYIRFFLPKEALTPLKIGSESIDPEIVYNTITVFLLYFIVIFVSAFIFMIYGFNPVDSLFEVSSALGTVGLSCGITCAGMPVFLKVVLIFDMLLGRIEIIPLFILLLPRTWIKREKRVCG
ncbi:trk system potassium uptake protein TrkH [Methanomicrobium sp. W14]|uniref:TrkH family potassium uptake protein n=1 Tax=Methanomicrobium sp. W14 TaxID=2817839 RepID=UPI001AE1D198|nr:TrkH family potassium uptake protein [Methanomicrobium sp. W14]MBP2132664.1 trk system potassium uptake protein TrkH [Methanomicrobium sp. W14]